MSDEIEKKTSVTLFKTPSWGVLGAAFIVMLTAKCFGYATDISWWIVTLPLWGPWALAAIFFFGFYALIFIGLAVIGIVGVVLGIFYAIVDFFKNIFKQDDKDNDDEYRLHG